ncbi:DUF3021 family protein [Exiguobacterium sp. s149]|uniref:DUF3021 family protein n=1 Tax=Exiguobacterium TaxID=33986 RepID=UPI001BE72B5C|nr:DUF3021 family protein [Exiguobacterium sp. s149]
MDEFIKKRICSRREVVRVIRIADDVSVVERTYEGVHNMLVYGVMAFFLGLTSVIYEVRRWSFPKQIFIHWATMHVTILPLVIFSGFLPVTSLQEALLTYLKFNVSGLVLFTLSRILLKVRRQVKAS